jgi:hypothetical protein
MIKHVASNSVLSHFNPIVSLKPKMKELVNDYFFSPILKSYFHEKGGVENFEPLDVDKIKTETDFDRDKNFVNTYLYPEIINDIQKDENGVVHFKPKYVFTFDKDLTKEDNSLVYPYHEIFKDVDGYQNIKFWDGVMQLGEQPILYYIWVDLQMLIRFIKENERNFENVESPKVTVRSHSQSKYAIHREIQEVETKLRESVNEGEKAILLEQLTLLQNESKKPHEVLQGKGGNLRIHLRWDTIDDLDLHVIDPDGNEIYYDNKIALCQGSKGELDVDANSGTGTTSPPPEENIFWDKAPTGLYKVRVKLFKKRENIPKIHFTLKVIPANKDQITIPLYIKEEGDIIDLIFFEYSELLGLHNIEKKYLNSPSKQDTLIKN